MDPDSIWWGVDDYAFARLLRNWQEGQGFAAIDLRNRFAEAGNQQASAFWRVLAAQAGLYHESYDDAMKRSKFDPAGALAGLNFAMDGLHPDAPFALDELFRSSSAAALGLSHDEYVVQAAQYADLTKTMFESELKTALLTGTRPILFQERVETPSVDNPQWGAGSLFVVQWKAQQFAVTARHVIENLGAEPNHFRLMLPEYGVALEVDAVTPHRVRSDHDKDKDKDNEFDDIFFWLIDQNTPTDKHIEWWAFDLSRWYTAAFYLKPGQQLFAVGYPDAPDRYDAENFIIKEIPTILRGTLSTEQLFDGMLTMDTEESEHDIDGMSGGPVFAKLEKRFRYVGLIVRGKREARKIHFIDARHVIHMLDRAAIEIDADIHDTETQIT